MNVELSGAIPRYPVIVHIRVGFCVIVSRIVTAISPEQQSATDLLSFGTEVRGRSCRPILVPGKGKVQYRSRGR